MIVTYALGDDESNKKFEQDFCHLYYRIRQLDERIIYYYVRGSVHGIVFSGFNAAGIPYIDRVTFDDADARKYCKEVNAYLRQPPHKWTKLPMPKFDVEIRIAYGGDVYETRTFPFTRYGDEVLIELCKNVRQNAFKLYNKSMYGGNS